MNEKRKVPGLLNVTKIIVWPVAFLILSIFFLTVFRAAINDLINKVTKGNIQVSNKGFSLTFENSIRYQISQSDDLQNDIKNIVETASISQDRAVTLAWALIDKKLRRIMASSHWNNGIHSDIRSSIKALIDLGVLAPNNMSSIQVIEDERSRILEHKKEGNKANTEVAVISSIQILRNLYIVTGEDSVIEALGIPFYSDEACKIQISGVTGVAIKQLMFGGLPTKTSVYPTTRTDYKIGEHLTWDWNMSNVWNSLFYKDPTTGEVKEIFSSAEFVGGDIDAL